MRHVVTTVAVLGLLLGAITSSAGAQVDAGYVYVRIPEGFGIVIDKRFVASSFDFGVYGLLGAWTPAKEDVLAAEDALTGVREARPPATEPGKDVVIEDLVSRQYFGLEHEDGKRLFINGFCTGGIPEHPVLIIRVQDGGSCFWYAWYDMTTGEIIQYVENGEA